LNPAGALTASSPAHARLAVVFEDAGLLVVNKPADLVCHPTKGDAWSSLVSRARLYLGAAAEPQLLNRLDRETSGLVVFAKIPSTARELRRLWERRAITKQYLAIVRGVPATPAGEVDAPLGRDPASAVAIKDCVRPDGAPARTRWRRLRAFRRLEGDFSLLEVEPLTGRSTRSASTSRTSATRSWATNSTAATNGSTSISWRAGWMTPSARG
jgi:23S rRNA pseudouridine1911/1915/1917 synthase